jgi:hypothetical protein
MHHSFVLQIKGMRLPDLSAAPRDEVLGQFIISFLSKQAAVSLEFIIHERKYANYIMGWQVVDRI